MPHNGNSYQLVPGFLQISGDFMLINQLRTAQWWIEHTGNGIPDPVNFDAKGYPTSLSGTGLYTVFFVPLPSEYSGDWIIDWVGDFSLGFGSSTAAPDGAAGSSSGVNGTWRRKFTGSDGRVVFRIISMGAPVANPRIRIYRADHAAAQDAGYITTPEFRTLVSANFGILRDLDVAYKNRSTESSWAMRRPVGYAVLGEYFMPSLLCDGAMTNTGDAYSIAKAGFTLTHKNSIIAKINATSSGSEPTLNVEGTGAIVVRNQTGDSLDAAGNDNFLANRWAHFTYDADLNCWLKWGGATDPGSTAINPGIAPEEFLQICDECGCHPWFCPPYMACDNPMSDWFFELATFTKNTYPWMIPRFEVVPNELWNFALPFPATRYAWNKAQARWGFDFDTHNWAGMIGSIAARIIDGVYDGDSSRYVAVMGYQTLPTAGELTAQNARLNSTRYIAETIAGGYPADIPASYAAKNHVHQVAGTMYWGPRKTVGELCASGRADTYATDTDAAKTETWDWYIGDHDFGTDRQHHADWAASFNLTATFYEGGFSVDYLTSDPTLAITAASKAAQCVLTVSATETSGLLGKTYPISSVGGMTELNGNSYQIVAVNGNQVTINVNSTGFTTYTSGGVITFTGMRDTVNTIRDKSRLSEKTYNRTRQFYNELIRVGCIGPSQFWICSGTESNTYFIETPAGLAWGLILNDILGERSPSLTAIEHITQSKTKIRLGILS